DRIGLVHDIPGLTASILGQVPQNHSLFHGQHMAVRGAGELFRHIYWTPNRVEEDATMRADMLIGGRWSGSGSGKTENVTSPFDGTVVGEVPVAAVEDVDAALAAAEAGAGAWRGARAARGGG